MLHVSAGDQRDSGGFQRRRFDGIGGTTTRQETETDSFAGRTVADFQDGYALIEARRHNHPKVGEPAPDFELGLHDGSGTLRLSSYRGDRPVVLIFGSLT